MEPMATQSSYPQRPVQIPTLVTYQKVMTKKVASILDGGKNGSDEGIERVLIQANALGGPHACIWRGQAHSGLCRLLSTKSLLIFKPSKLSMGHEFPMHAATMCTHPPTITS